MDPIVIASITSAISVLARDVVTGAANELGKDLWMKVKSLLGWTKEPNPDDLVVRTAERIMDDEKLAKQLLELFQRNNVGRTSAIVGNIDTEKLIVIKEQKIERDFNIQM